MTVPVEILRGLSPVAVPLVEIEWPGETLRAWPGTTVLRTLDGREWQPVATFGTVGDVETGSALESPAVTMGLRLGPVDDWRPDADTLAAFVAALQEARGADIEGAPARIYLQVFGPDDALSGVPIGQAALRLSSRPSDKWEGIESASITVTAEHVLTFGLGGAADGNLTAASQRARFPGDAGADYVQAPGGAIWPRD